MIITRIWEEKEKGAETKYYSGQIQLPDGNFITVTQEFESAQESQFYLNIVLYGLSKLGINPSSNKEE